MKLFDISTEFEQLFAQLDNTEDMVEDERAEFETAWFDTLEAIEGEFEAKAENVALYIKECLEMAEDLKVYKASIATRQKVYENRAQRLKIYLKNCMDQMKLKKVETPKARISIRNNAPALVISDELKFIGMLQEHGRDDLLKYSAPEINKAELKKLIKNGEQFEGARLEASQSLTIG